MLRSVGLCALCSLAVALGACDGNNTRPPPPAQPDASVSTDTGVDSGALDAGPDTGLPDTGPRCADPAAPVATIASPTAATDPNTEVLVITESLTVVCQVTASTAMGASPVDETSVTVTVAGVGGAAIGSVTATKTGTDTYEATFDLSAQRSGALSVLCAASDTMRRCAEDTVATFFDQGPTVILTAPLEDAVHSPLMRVSYRLTPAPVSPADTLAAIAGHTLTVAGQVITAVVEPTPGDFVADIDFGDLALFPTFVPGPHDLSVVAWNGRVPMRVETRVVRRYTIDADGPTISITTPTEAQLVGGRFQVQATVADPSGVDAASVFMRFGVGPDEPMTEMTTGSGLFETSFDASRFGTAVTDITFNVVASDLVGNGGAAPRSVKLDSVAPVASLEPPLVREGRMGAGGFECSNLYDPVGSDSVSDGQVVGTAAEFRVRVEDLSNSSFGGMGTVTFLAGVDPTTVDLYVLDNVAVPLLVDTSLDGVCDAINPAVDPATGGADRAIVLQLDPLAPTGTPFFGPDPTPTAGSPAFAGCVAGMDAAPPPPLCITTPLWRVIPSAGSSMTATIYAKAPIGGLTCAGDAWSFLASLTEGWACVAVRVQDRLGNVGLSAPIRACFIDGVAPDPCPGGVGAVAPLAMRPSCTDGCTPPAGFSLAPGLQLIDPPL